MRFSRRAGGNTIRGRSFGGKQSVADCVRRAAQTMVATEKGQGQKEAPTLEEIRAKLAVQVARRNAENEASVGKMNANETDPAKRIAVPRLSFDREHGLMAAGPSYLNIMTRVLAQYGVATTADLNEDPKQRLTPKQLADKLIAKGTPAMLNVKEDRMGANSRSGHAVTVQWDPQSGNDGKGRFLVNNLTAEGDTRVFTRQRFESGTLQLSRVGARSFSSFSTTRQKIDLDFPIIYVERP